MDTSPEYIRQCEKAEEIQSLWKPTGGDWYIHDYRGTTRTSRAFEKQVWEDSDKTWQEIEIMCYRPSESKDVIVSTDGEESRCVSVVDLTKEHSIWLPRQDQLQEMLGQNWEWVLEQFIIWDADVPIDDRDFEQMAHSMEQLWFAFVMKEKYGKVWDGENWVE